MLAHTGDRPSASKFHCFFPAIVQLRGSMDAVSKAWLAWLNVRVMWASLPFSEACSADHENLKPTFIPFLWPACWISQYYYLLVYQLCPIANDAISKLLDGITVWKETISVKAEHIYMYTVDESRKMTNKTCILSSIWLYIGRRY